MAFVLDCSVTMTWLFEDEAHEGADALQEPLTDNPAVVPPLWPVEVANAVLVATRRGRLADGDWSHVQRHLGALPIEIDTMTFERAVGHILPLASRHGLTAYDASYLELASRRGLPLATLDRQLADACRAAGVALCLGHARGHPHSQDD